MILEQAQLEQIETHIAEILPELIRRNPKIARTIEGILAELFPRRDEFARLLDELTAHRVETAENFVHVRSEIHDVQDDLTIHRTESAQRFDKIESELGDFRTETRERFGQVDRRFEQVDQRFEQVDRRFEQVDRRFEQVDQRFDRVDQRFDQVEGRLGRVEGDLRIVKRDVAQLKHGQEMILKQLSGQEAWLRLTVGTLRDEKGRTLEDMFAAGLRHGLQDPTITAESIRLRQPLIDSEGVVFTRRFETEVDLIAQNGKLIVFEIKATGKISEVDLFALKVDLMKAQNPDKEVSGVFICLGASAAIQERCSERGLLWVG